MNRCTLENQYKSQRFGCVDATQILHEIRNRNYPAVRTLENSFSLSPHSCASFMCLSVCATLPHIPASSHSLRATLPEVFIL